IDHRSTFGTSTTILTVALGAIFLICGCAPLLVALSGALCAGVLETVWRKSHVLKIFRLAPPRPHPLNQYVNLFVGKWAADLLREGGRCGSRYSLRDRLVQRVVAHQSEIERIVQRPRRPQAPIGAVTTGTVQSVELRKICHFRRALPAVFRGWLSRQPVTADCQREKHNGHQQWSGGILEYWSTGFPMRHSSTPTLQYSSLTACRVMLISLLSFPTSLQEPRCRPSQPVATSAWSRPSLNGAPRNRSSFRKRFATRRTRSSQCVHSTLD